jgi:hypothetical protein
VFFRLYLINLYNTESANRGHWLWTWEFWCHFLAFKFNGDVSSCASAHITIRICVDTQNLQCLNIGTNLGNNFLFKILNQTRNNLRFLVVFGALVDSVFTIGPNPRFAGLNPAEGDGFLRAIKIRSMPSFGGEVKPSAPCCNILRHDKEPYEYERDLRNVSNKAYLFIVISPRNSPQWQRTVVKAFCVFCIFKWKAQVVALFYSFAKI